MLSLQAVVRFIHANRDYRIRRDFSGVIPAPTLRQGLTELVSRVLKKVPGSKRLLKPSLLDPWSTFRLTNMVFLEKEQEDPRDWRFHREF